MHVIRITMHSVEMQTHTEPKRCKCIHYGDIVQTLMSAYTVFKSKRKNCKKTIKSCISQSCKTAKN